MWLGKRIAFEYADRVLTNPKFSFISSMREISVLPPPGKLQELSKIDNHGTFKIMHFETFWKNVFSHP